MNKKIKEEIRKLYNDGNKIYTEFLNDKDNIQFISLSQKYQSWYTTSNIIIKEILPNRYKEFIEMYSCSKRKEIIVSNYTIQDFLTGIVINGLNMNEAKIFALMKFINQLNIVKSLVDNIDNVLFNVKSNIEFELLDDELYSSRKLLKKGFIRSAGAISGVVLEKHFSTVLENHNLKIERKDPSISDYNDLFKKENIYDVINWRFIQRLGDIRNLCDHNKSREPTKEEVEDLINGTEKIIKTVF